MGGISRDAEIAYFKGYSEHRSIVSTFLHEFDVNYATDYRKYSTNLHLFLIKPSKGLCKIFGFSEEILLVYSYYDRLEARTIQAIEAVFSDKPFNMRANPLLFFLVTNDDNGSQWVENYLVDHPQFRTPVVFSEKEAKANGGNRSFVRSVLYKSLFSRDIFDYQLPLDRDLYFYGRSKDVSSAIDAVRKSQNKGIFGLRKTGKTSLIFKIRRALESGKIAYCVYLDCKLPMIRSKKWKEMITYICEQVERQTKRKISENEPEEKLRRILESLEEKERVCVIFDEIEYISPIASRDEHWHKDFVDFWQTMWSLQSEIRKLSFIVAGVNPYVTEVDLVDGVQNPMFGIVQGLMLTGLDHDACVSMITRIGRQMGLEFEGDALDYLHERYGGHPLLTRMACSFANGLVTESEQVRPFSITAKSLRDTEGARDGELSFYCRHIVSELEIFYPDEYRMLTMLARGEIVDFVELSAEPEWIRHLKGYGILNFDKGSRPKFRIPVLQRYIANEAARIDGTREPRKVVPIGERSLWLARRKRAILTEFKSLLHSLSDKGMEIPFPSRYLPEADRIESLSVVTSWSEFQAMITGMNMALVETIEQGKGTKYFFGKFKGDMPSLFSALSRVKVYRNNADHLRLNRNVEVIFNQFIKIDLMNKDLSDYKEPWFVLQQVVMDELLVSLLLEADKVS